MRSSSRASADASVDIYDIDAATIRALATSTDSNRYLIGVTRDAGEGSSLTCICLHRIFMRDDVRTGEFRSDRRITMFEVMGKPVFSRDLTDGSRVHRFNVERAPAQGWLVREERDAQVNRSPMPTGTASSSPIVASAPKHRS
jgi:hypothetical protein